MANIGEILQALLREERIKRKEKERPTERYARVEIDLGKPEFVGTDIELHLKGDYLGKIKYDGNSSTYIRLNHRHAGKIYCSEFRRTWASYDRIYLTNPTAQTGKKLILSVGGAFSGEIEPATGAKMGLVDSSGSDIDPAQSYKEDEAHSSGDRGVQALAVRKDTAAALAGTDGDYHPLEVDANGRLHVIEPSQSQIQTDIGDIKGDISTIKTDIDLIKSDADDIRQAVETAGTVYNKSVSAGDSASQVESSSTKLVSVVIKNTHANYEALIGNSTSQVFQLKGGASLSLDAIDLVNLYIKAETGGENPTLHLIGTYE